MSPTSLAIVECLNRKTTSIAIIKWPLADIIYFVKEIIFPIKELSKNSLSKNASKIIKKDV